MIDPPRAAELPDDWIVSLHEALAAETAIQSKANPPAVAQSSEAQSSASQPSATQLSGAHSPQPLDAGSDQVAQVRSCLSLLEGLRQVNLESGGLVSELLDDYGEVDSLDGLESICIGRFEIIEEIGRGGHGIVLLAYDPTLKRQVALKVPRPEVLASRQMRERFIREANAAARLTHPAIVQVYELGDSGPVCYIAAEYCPGQTLAAVIREQGPYRDEREAARLVLTLAEAVEYANSRGVLHRDLKPANVLFVPMKSEVEGKESDSATKTVTFVPKLTDFGLAKLVDVEEENTRTGAMLGTPAYMAPEQAHGQVHELGPPTDVYGLGTILYEMLSGRPPFIGTSDVDLLKQVVDNEPTSLLQLRRDLSPDLAAICHKCLEKRPAKRYQTAANLATDLRCYLAGEAITARPATHLERTLKWVRRYPAAAALVGVSTLALLLISVGGWLAYDQTRRALDEADARRLEAERNAAIAMTSDRQSQRLNYTSTTRLAWRAWQNDNYEEACHLLDGCRPTSGKEDLREFCWYHLWNLTHQHEQSLIGHIGDVYRVEFSPDGVWLASAGHDQTVRIWNAHSGQVQHVLTGHTQDVNGVAFSPDSRTVASTSDDGTIRIWDRPTGALISVLQGHEGQPVLGLGFSPDGETLASGGKDARIVLWNTDTWTLRHVLVHHTADIEFLVYSPDGVILASASDDDSIKLWNTSTWDLMATLQPRRGSAHYLAFSRDGKQLASSGLQDRQVRLWDVAKQQELRTLTQTFDWVQSVEFCDNDRQLAVACKDGTLNLLNLKEGSTRKLLGHFGRVWNVATTADGMRLASAGSDGTIKLWSLQGEPAQQAIANRGGLYSIGYAADGSLTFGGEDPFSLSTLSSEIRAQPVQIGIAQSSSGDFNGDGVTDQLWFANGAWAIELAGDAYAPLEKIAFGNTDDLPVVGDWNGDGLVELGVFRLGKFFLRGVTPPGKETVRELVLGDATSIPIVADWNGDRRDEVGVIQNDRMLIDLELSGHPAEFQATLPTVTSEPRLTTAGKPGALDATFGDAGVVVCRNPTSSAGVAITIQSDGKIATAFNDAISWSALDVGVLRLNPNGTRDRDFQERVSTSDSPISYSSMVIQPDNKLLVLQESWHEGIPQTRLWRREANGKADVTFGPEHNGCVTFRFGPGENRAPQLTLQPDGKIIVVGKTPKPGTPYSQIGVARFNSDGSLDTSFGPEKSGVVHTVLASWSDDALCVQLQPDGKILVGGYSWDLNFGYAAIVRYRADGSLDPSFGEGGKSIHSPAGCSTNLFGLSVSEQGDIFAVGTHTNARTDGMIVKYSSNGQLDKSFGAGGWLTMPVNPDAEVLIRCALDSRGRLVAAGYSTSGSMNKLILRRFLPDGTLETDFCEAIRKHPSLACDQSTAFGLTIVAADRPVVTGHVGTAQKYDLMVCRFQAEPSSRTKAVPHVDDSTDWPGVAHLKQVLTPQLIDQARERKQVDSPRQSVRHLAVSPSGDVVATCSEWDSDVRILERSTGRMIAVLRGNQTEVLDVVFSPDGRQIASAGQDTTIKIWNTSDWTELATLSGHLQSVRGVAFSHDGKYLASAGGEGARIWRLSDYQQVAAILTHSHLTCVQFSLDDRLLATAGADRFIKLWEPFTGRPLAALSGHKDRVRAVGFSPDGRTLASCSLDGAVRLWDLHTFQELAVLRGVAKRVFDVEFSPDGNKLTSVGATQDDHGELNIWNASSHAANAD